VICKASRYIMFFFPMVTVMNYLLIGIERYLGIFHPLRLPSRALCKKCVVVAWLLGGLLTGLPIPTYVIRKYDLKNKTFTYICNYNTSNRFLFAVFILLGYIIPSIILIGTCIRIWKFIRRRSRPAASSESENTGSDPTNASASRPQHNSSSGYRMTSMLVILIFTFILPFIVFVVYSTVLILIKLKVTFHVHYTTRMVSAALVYGNTAISPCIIMYNSKYLRRKLSSLVKKLLCCMKRIQVVENIEMRVIKNR